VEKRREPPKKYRSCRGSTAGKEGKGGATITRGGEFKLKGGHKKKIRREKLLGKKSFSVNRLERGKKGRVGVTGVEERNDKKDQEKKKCPKRNEVKN